MTVHNAIDTDVLIVGAGPVGLCTLRVSVLVAI